jgi:putative membrane protein
MRVAASVSGQLTMNTDVADEQRIFAIERPDPKLMIYYALCCLLAGPFLPIALIPAWFRYHTMRYRFDTDGISMRWGILFRREIVLSYARFQDIHLSSNVVERWLGLARIEIQTASGSAKAEMTIEGLLEFEAIRDFLYRRMRGHQGVFSQVQQTTAGVAASAGRLTAGAAEEIAGALREVARELRGIREALADRKRIAPPQERVE